MTHGFPWAEVIGDPVAHSKSPLIHGFWLEKLGLAGRYEKTHVARADLASFFADRRQKPAWLGCNVTIPHKQAILPLLDRIDPMAARIGAVNTVVKEGEALVGYNSDAGGFLEPLRPLLADRHYYRMARILGAGGAARAIAHALAAEGFTIVVAARDTAKAEALCATLHGVDTHVATLASFAKPFSFDWGDRSGQLDLVINASSLGMAGQPRLEVNFGHVPPGSIVYDIVYSPLETALLAEARSRGLRTVDGLEMLIGQAAEAFARFFGRPAPRGEDAALRALLTE